MEQVFDLLRMVSHVIKSPEERITKILRSLKEPIVCDKLACVIPDTLGCIQFRPVGRKLEDFYVAAVGFEPIVGLLLFVIRRVVLDQVDPVAAPVEGGHDHLLQESQIGLPLKIILLMEIDETGVVQTDGPENLLCMAFPSRGNLRLLPRLAQVACRVGVCRNEASSSKTITAPSVLAFFLDSGTCSAPICGVASHRPEPAWSWAVAPSSPTAGATSAHARRDTVARIPLR